MPKSYDEYQKLSHNALAIVAQSNEIRCEQAEIRAREYAEKLCHANQEILDLKNDLEKCSLGHETDE